MEIEVNSTIENQVGVFRLAREKALNSLTHSMIKKIHRDAYNWSQREEISCVMFPTLLQKVYCAGGDIRWLYEQGKSGHHEQQMAFFADEYRLDYAMGHLPKPVLAIIDGFLIGGGMGLIMPAQTVYATQKAVFSMPETGIGFFPDVGMSYQLNKCPGHTGLYLALTGQRFNAYEAQYLGLVEDVLADDDALQIQSMALESVNDPNLYQTITRALADKVIKADQIPIKTHREQIDEAFSGKSVEKIFSKLEKMSDSWAKETLKKLKRACPLSLRITFELLQKMHGKSQAYSHELDYTVAYHFMHCSDFYEGVRTQVIDKDRTPKWQFGHISEVPQSVVERFFSPLDVPLDLTYRPGLLETECLGDQ